MTEGVNGAVDVILKDGGTLRLRAPTEADVAALVTFLAGLLLGSVTQRLLHIAPCPVLAVPAAAHVSAEPREREEASVGV